MPLVKMTYAQLKFVRAILGEKTDNEGPDTDGYYSARVEDEEYLIDETSMDNLIHELDMKSGGH